MIIKRQKIWMTAFAALVLAASIGGCQKDENVGIVGVCPIVISTDPENLETGVPVTKTVTVTFNEKMDPATINSSSFSLQGPAGKVAGSLVYDDATASIIFDPTAFLDSNTTYTGMVESTVKDMMGNALQTDYIWTFSTGGDVAPMVVSTDPANNATGVFLNKVVSATFNMAMDTASINAATFTLTQGGNPVAGTVTYSGNTAYFTPSAPLIANTVYTGTITTGAKNSAGIALANKYVWTFTTGALVAPMVISTDPTRNEKGVVLSKAITATFSEPMDPATINNSTFVLSQGANIIAGTVTYSGTTATFTPTVALNPNTIYTGKVTTGAKNLAGTPLVNDYIWSFTTLSLVNPSVISTDPANNATNVVLNKVVTATFNMAMDPLTINSSTFIVKQGANIITGTVSYSGTTASFTPTVAFSPNTVYTATITTGAKNLAGTALANDYVWSFTTETPSAPQVISTDPANNATGVVLNKVITATFNMTMDAATISALTFTVKNGSNPVTGTVGYSGTTATFTPTLPLASNTVYTATITTGAKNLAGTPLASDYVWSFTTETAVAPKVTSTDPVNNETDVALNKTITASFDMTMDGSTINTSTFLVKNGANTVSGTVSYSGTTATFKPTNNLLSGTTYTATITTGAKNLAGVPLANDYVWTFKTKAPLGPQAIDLKGALDFGILAYTGISNNAGPSEINDMNIGIYPGTSVTGFPPGKVNNGAIFTPASSAADVAKLKQAMLDLKDAYLEAEGATSPAPSTVSGDQGGKTLSPGIYKSTSTLGINNGDLTLDAMGDPNAVWIFQIASGFTTVGGSGGNVVLTGGAQAKNIFWQVGSSATIGDGTSFYGNILAYTSITMNSDAVAEGRMLALNGAVTLTSTNTINKP